MNPTHESTILAYLIIFFANLGTYLLFGSEGLGYSCWATAIFLLFVLSSP